MTGDLQRLQEIIGRNFEKTELLEEAISHSSAGKSINYQRLEFLGDRVLGIVVAEFLIKNFPGENEGDLARRFSSLVDKTMLARVATDAGIGDFIAMSDSERASGGGENENILSDVMEAIIGASFLDAGLDDCRVLVYRMWGELLNERVDPPIDPKTALQEWTQGRAKGLPVYDLVSRTGPDHAPTFEISVDVEGFPIVSAKGASRRVAEKEAARKMLALIEGKENA